MIELIVSPSEEVYRMSRSRLNLGGIPIVILAVYSSTISLGILFSYSGGLISFMFTWGAAARVVFCLVSLLAAAAFYHYFAAIMGGRGNPSSTFRGLLYTLSPICFLVPVALVSKVLAGNAFFFLFFAFALCYTAFLHYKVICYFYGLPPSKAAYVLVLPWLILLISFLLSFLFLGTGLVSVLL